MKRDELKDAVSCFRLGNCTRQESDVRKWTIWTDNQDCAWRLFFPMNSKLWGKFRRHVPRMTAPEEKIELNPKRRVYNKEHNGQNYIVFENDWKNESDEDVQSWINLDEDEWQAFVKILWQIDQVMPTFQRYTCVVCLDQRTTVDLWSGKLQRTLLDEDTLAEAIDANAVDRAGQDGPIVCEYCGDAMAVFRCHCHKYNCRQCSDDSYCKGCGENVYIVSQQDD